MVIQRIQSLFLLLASLITAFFCFLPFANVHTPDGYTAVLVADVTPLLIISILTALLLFGNIFKFKNLVAQMRTTLICAVLECALIAEALILTFHVYDNATPAYCGGFFLPLIALIFTIMAYRGMKHDKHLLSSADRLR